MDEEGQKRLARRSSRDPPDDRQFNGGRGAMSFLQPENFTTKCDFLAALCDDTQTGDPSPFPLGSRLGVFCDVNAASRRWVQSLAGREKMKEFCQFRYRVVHKPLVKLTHLGRLGNQCGLS